MMIMIHRLLLAFEFRLQPYALRFELSLINLLVAAVRRSAAAPDPHAALMRMPHGPIAYYHTHQY